MVDRERERTAIYLEDKQHFYKLVRMHKKKKKHIAKRTNRQKQTNI